MSTQNLILVALGLLVILTLVVIIRYRSKAEANFSIRDWISFAFSGENTEEMDSEQHSSPKISLRDSSIVAEEFVGRDKVTHIHSSENKHTPNELPVLVLRFLTDTGLHRDHLSITQPQPPGVIQDLNFKFGLALINTREDSVPAQGIDIRLEVSWDGDDLDFAPKFNVDVSGRGRTTPGWRATRPKVQQAENEPLPALLDFNGSAQDRCAFGHPLEWMRFHGHLAKKVDGRFKFNYHVSSTDPHTSNSGLLLINLI